MPHSSRPPPTHALMLSLLSPKGERKGLRRVLAIQSQAEPFKTRRLSIGMLFLDHFCFKPQITFQNKSHSFLIGWGTHLWNLSLGLRSLDTRHSERFFKQRWSMYFFVQSLHSVDLDWSWEVFQTGDFEKRDSLREVTNPSLTAFQERLCAPLRQPPGSLQLHDVIIRVPELLKSLLVLPATLSVVVRILQL